MFTLCCFLLYYAISYYCPHSLPFVAVCVHPWFLEACAICVVSVVKITQYHWVLRKPKLALKKSLSTLALVSRSLFRLFLAIAFLQIAYSWKIKLKGYACADWVSTSRGNLAHGAIHCFGKKVLILLFKYNLLLCFWPTVVSAMQAMKALVCSVVKLTLVPNPAVVVAITRPSAPRLGQVPITAHVVMVSVVMALRALLSIHVRWTVLGIAIATLIVSTLALDRSVILDEDNFYEGIIQSVAPLETMRVSTECRRTHIKAGGLANQNETQVAQ